MRLHLLLLGALLLVAALATPAPAATVSATFVDFRPGDRYYPDETHYRIEVVDPIGERNELEIDARRVRATAGALVAGPGCTATAPGEVTCALAPRNGSGDVRSTIAVDAGDGDDRVVSRTIATLRGGAGDDQLLLHGVGGTLDGGLGADLLAGPARAAAGSTDQPRALIDYGTRTGAVRVTPGFGGADDGEPGEGDEVTGVIGQIRGGFGSDELHGSDLLPTVLDGGGGDDRLLAGAAGGQLLGGPGGDVLQGGAAGEILDGGPGADVLRGGPGDDTADFSTARGPVRVTLDDRPDDGAAGERDDVGIDVEEVMGTSGDDVLVGGPDANRLRGFAGDDRLEGGGGDDVLDGDEGDDVLRGGAGDDRLDGGTDDEAFATHGDDIDAGPGRDAVTAAGADRVVLRDGERDTMTCGPQFSGHHGALVGDASDKAVGCAPRMGWRSGGRLDRGGRLRFVVTCPSAAALRCRGMLRVFDGRAVGSVRVSVAPGRRQAVRVRLKARTVRKIRRRSAGLTLGVNVDTVRSRPRSVLAYPGLHDRVRVRPPR